MNLPVRPMGEWLEWIPVNAFAVGCLVAGFLFLLLGWSMYRVMLLVVGAALGGFIGWWAARLFGINPFYLALPLGLATGVVAFLAEKVGAFCAGGLCAVIPVFMFVSFAEAGAILFALAGAAFVVAGVLTLLLWKPLVTISLSLLGAVAVANGLLLITEGYNPDLADRITIEYPPFLIAGILTMALAGILFQTRSEEAEGVD